MKAGRCLYLKLARSVEECAEDALGEEEAKLDSGGSSQIIFFLVSRLSSFAYETLYEA